MKGRLLGPGTALLAFAAFVNAADVSAQAHWQLSASPMLVIGSMDGPDALVFQDIRGAFVTADTLIVVADGATREVRIFNRAGEFLTAFGQEGDGPREFQGIDWVDECGGRAIVVFDRLRQRVTRWDTGGRLLEDFRIEPIDGGRPAYRLSCGPDGRFVVVGWPDVTAFTGGTGPYRLDVRIGTLDRHGRVERVLGTFPGPERYRYTTNDGPRPLGKTITARMGSDAVYVGTGDSYQIRVLDFNGNQRTLGDSSPPTPLTQKMIERWQDSILAEVDPQRRPALRRAFDDYELPTSLPAYSEFQLDRLGDVWIVPYGIPGEPPEPWDVFDAAGRSAASVRIPVHFRPTDIGADYILGVATGPLDVERIQMYHLSRTTSDGAGASPGGSAAPLLLHWHPPAPRPSAENET